MSQTPTEKSTRKATGKLLIKIYFGIFLVLILLWGIILGVHLLDLYRLAKSLNDDPSQIQAQNIGPTINEAAHDVNAIYSQIKPLFPILNAIQGLPLTGEYLGQVEPLLTYADGLASAGKEIALGLEPLLEEKSSSQIDLTLPEHASQVLQSGQAHFMMAAQSIEQASRVRNRINPDLMPHSVRLLFLKIDGKFDSLVAGGQFLQEAPSLLGINQAQNYLVLAQNRDELRATGGFISGIGLLTFQNGKILQFTLGDSYVIDDFSKPYPTPPEALKRFMLADYWVTRDANWSPDFPTTAKEAQALYTLSTGVETQGVIAFNQLAIQKVLEVIGPVQVPETDEPVTAENVENYMRQAWAPAPEEGLSQEWWLHRKDFMPQLGNVILEKVLASDDQDQLLRLAKTILDLLDQGQLLVYFNDPIAQAALDEGGWDGGLHPGNDDYLYLVDSNVGFNKVDSVVQRSILYKVDLSDPTHPTGEVTLTYQHTGSGDQACRQEISYGSGTYQDMQERCYLDYWRIYVPGGSELLASNAIPVAAEVLLNGQGWSGQVDSSTGEAGTQILAGLLMLPIGQSSQIVISYRIPPSLLYSMGRNILKYTLQIQVQPGLDGLPFQLEIKSPENSNLINPDGSWKLLSDKTCVWQGVLDRSTELSVSYQLNP